MALQRTCDGCGKGLDKAFTGLQAQLEAVFRFKWHDFVLKGTATVGRRNEGRGRQGTVDICLGCAEDIRVAMYRRFADLDPNVPLVKEAPKKP